MLNNIEKLYLKTYQSRYGNKSVAELLAQTEEVEREFNNSFPNSENQRKAAGTLNELIYYVALLHVNDVGHANDVIFMGTGVFHPNDGMTAPLPPAVKPALQSAREDFWFMSNPTEDWYAVYVDVKPDSPRGKVLKEMFNTTDTAPRMALRSFVVDRITQQTP